MKYAQFNHIPDFIGVGDTPPDERNKNSGQRKQIMPYACIDLFRKTYTRRGYESGIYGKKIRIYLQLHFARIIHALGEKLVLLEKMLAITGPVFACGVSVQAGSASVVCPDNEGSARFFDGLCH